MPGALISVEEARARVLAAVRALASEPVPAPHALGRVLAEDVVSGLDLPPFDSSAMDGYAIAAGSLVLESGGECRVAGESRAGAPFTGAIEVGEAIRISTGAVVPDGVESVVPVERTEITAADQYAEIIRIVGATPSGSHIRRAGEDVRRGDLVLRAGVEIGAAEMGMLAALGRTEVQCARRPRVALVATGDELAEPGEPLRPGQIYDSNAAAIAALASRAGAELAGRSNAGDTHERTVAALAEQDADVLCISGGVSVGPHDHVKFALADLGFEELIWGVRLKPGKPFYFGKRGDQYAFGLPGNPVSAMVTFILFARPALRALQGADPGATRSTAVLDGPIKPNSDRDQAVRCRLHVREDGFHAEPTGPQGSHVMSSMLDARALAIVPAGERELAPGERVTVELI